jgi:hypothetical protein
MDYRTCFDGAAGDVTENAAMEMNQIRYFLAVCEQTLLHISVRGIH